MEGVVSDFLKSYFPEKQTLLLGLSGGPDSMALFYLLLEMAYPFEVAHVDHGWRAESGREAAELKELCQKKGLPFHTTQLSPSDNNKEDHAREGRLAFFKHIVQIRNLAGLLLAHQADDQAETVLKRLFEGASLPKLRGLRARMEWQGLVIYRPLLHVRKEEILKWLEDRKILYFQDPTNLSAQFLRGRLRESVIPFLSQHFGKEVAPSLCRIGSAALELEAFLEEQMEPFLSRIQQTTDQISLDFAQGQPHSLFLWKSVIRNLFERQRTALSTATLEMILAHLQKGSHHKSLKVGKQKVLIHRKSLTIQRNCL